MISKGSWVTGVTLDHVLNILETVLFKISCLVLEKQSKLFKVMLVVIQLIKKLFLVKLVLIQDFF